MTEHALPAPPSTALDVVDQPAGRESAGRVAGGFLMDFAGHTLDAYRRDLRQWFEWCALFDTDPLDATRPLLSAYVRHLHGEKARAAATIARKMSAVGGFYRYAVDEDHISRSPVPRDRRRLNLPRVARESSTLGPDLAHAKRMVQVAGGRGPRDRAIVLVLLSTAMRVSELTGLDLADMTTHEARRIVTVTRKGGKRQRLLLVPDAAAAVDAYLAARWSQASLLPALPGEHATSGPLFADEQGRRLTRDAVAWVIRWCSTADQPGGTPAVSPHGLRHAAITMMIENGRSMRDVQQYVGHTDPSTTQRYAHDAEALSKAPALALDGLFT